MEGVVQTGFKIETDNLRESGKQEPDNKQLNRWTDDLIAQGEAIFADCKEER